MAAPLNARSLWIVWGSMLVSTTVFGTLIGVIPAETKIAGFEITGMLAGAALAASVLSMAWGRLIAQAQPAQSKWMVRWALGEAVGLFGLVTHLIGGPDVVAGVLVAYGFLVILVQMPLADRA